MFQSHYPSRFPGLPALKCDLLAAGVSFSAPAFFIVNWAWLERMGSALPRQLGWWQRLPAAAFQSRLELFKVIPMVILVAEDHEDVRLAIWNLLKADGFTVLSADDGKTALELSRSYPGTIDLLLSDIDMPRMGGVELCRVITAERPGTKVLMISGGVESAEQVRMKGLPYLQKPFSGTALRESITALLAPNPPLRTP